MNPSNWVAVTILPRRSCSLSMGDLQVLHEDRPDLAYSAFHGLGGFAIAGETIEELVPGPREKWRRLEGLWILQLIL